MPAQTFPAIRQQWAEFMALTSFGPSTCEKLGIPDREYAATIAQIIQIIEAGADVDNRASVTFAETLAEIFENIGMTRGKEVARRVFGLKKRGVGEVVEPLCRLDYAATYWILTSSTAEVTADKGYGYNQDANASYIGTASTDLTGGVTAVSLIRLDNDTTGDTYYTTSASVVSSYEHNGYSPDTTYGSPGYVSNTTATGYTAIYNAFNTSASQNAFGTLSQINAMNSNWTKFTSSPQFYSLTT